MNLKEDILKTEQVQTELLLLKEQNRQDTQKTEEIQITEGIQKAEQAVQDHRLLRDLKLQEQASQNQEAAVSLKEKAVLNQEAVEEEVNNIYIFIKIKSTIWGLCFFLSFYL
jgi:uncharacterized protein YaiL (DUF2058 family)